MYVCLLQAKALFSFEKHLPTDAPTPPPPPSHLHLTCSSLVSPIQLALLASAVPDMTGSSPYRRSWLLGHHAGFHSRTKRSLPPPPPNARAHASAYSHAEGRW